MRLFLCAVTNNFLTFIHRTDTHSHTLTADNILSEQETQLEPEDQDRELVDGMTVESAGQQACRADRTFAGGASHRITDKDQIVPRAVGGEAANCSRKVGSSHTGGWRHRQKICRPSGPQRTILDLFMRRQRQTGGWRYPVEEKR